jgi:hypothetical protein
LEVTTCACILEDEDEDQTDATTPMTRPDYANTLISAMHIDFGAVATTNGS